MNYEVGQILYYAHLELDEKERKFTKPVAEKYLIVSKTSTFIFVVKQNDNGKPSKIRIEDIGKPVTETSAITSWIRPTPEEALEVMLDLAERGLKNIEEAIAPAKRRIKKIKQAIKKIKDGR